MGGRHRANQVKGGDEGPRKLHFEKPLRNDRECEVLEEIMEELRGFLDGAGEVDDDDLVKRCEANAQRVRGMILEKM